MSVPLSAWTQTSTITKRWKPFRAWPRSPASRSEGMEGGLC